jgi:hypothetical protein
MADHEIRVTIRADYAPWPGEGVFLIRYRAIELDADGWLLVDSSGRRSELVPYRVGMNVGMPR